MAKTKDTKAPKNAIKVQVPKSRTAEQDKAISRLAARASTDEEAKKELFRIFEEEGMTKLLIEDIGNLGVLARKTMIKAFMGEDLVVVECTKRKMYEMRQALEGPEPTPIEKLLAERVAVCWLRLYYYEIYQAQQQRGQDLEWFEFWERRIDKANKRYLASLKALAQVRKLQLPSVQVNIGEKQVNVGQLNS